MFDRRHRSAALVKRNGTVIGGITYRAFPQQGLGEIAFCAIASTEQVCVYEREGAVALPPLPAAGPRRGCILCHCINRAGVCEGGSEVVLGLAEL